jgi:hypothetical protein
MDVAQGSSMLGMCARPSSICCARMCMRMTAKQSRCKSVVEKVQNVVFGFLNRQKGSASNLLKAAASPPEIIVSSSGRYIWR